MGSRFDGVVERPKAVSEYLVDRMVIGGATKICFVISPNKTDIIRYYSGQAAGAEIAYVVQPEPAGLCDAVFRAAPLIRDDEPVVLGLPDTIWFPEDAIRALPDDRLSFLLFPVNQPQFFDVVITDDHGRVREIQVKSDEPRSAWIWGAIKMPGHIFHALHGLWRAPERGDEYIGTLVNAYLDAGGEAVGVRAGETYVDVGTLHGYREALRVLTSNPSAAAT